MHTCEGVAVPVLVAGAGHTADKGAAEWDLPLESRCTGLAELPSEFRGTQALLHPARPCAWPGVSRRELELAQGQSACEREERSGNGMLHPLLCSEMLQTGTEDPKIPP